MCHFPTYRRTRRELGGKRASGSAAIKSQPSTGLQAGGKMQMHSAQRKCLRGPHPSNALLDPPLPVMAGSPTKVDEPITALILLAEPAEARVSRSRGFKFSPPTAPIAHRCGITSITRNGDNRKHIKESLAPGCHSDLSLIPSAKTSPFNELAGGEGRGHQGNSNAFCFQTATGLKQAKDSRLGG